MQTHSSHVLTAMVPKSSTWLFFWEAPICSLNFILKLCGEDIPWIAIQTTFCCCSFSFGVPRDVGFLTDHMPQSHKGNFLPIPLNGFYDPARMGRHLNFAHTRAHICSHDEEKGSGREHSHCQVHLWPTSKAGLQWSIHFPSTFPNEPIFYSFISQPILSKVHDSNEDRLRKYPAQLSPRWQFSPGSDREMSCRWREPDSGVCTGIRGTLGAFWSLLGGSPALLGSHMVDFQSHPHSPQLSQGIIMHGRRDREMSWPSSPMGHGVSNTVEKTQILEHQCFVWVMGWQSHGYIQPCLPAHPAAISMSQESGDSRKNYENMAWVFFPFYEPPAPSQCGAQPFV